MPCLHQSAGATMRLFVFLGTYKNCITPCDFPRLFASRHDSIRARTISRQTGSLCLRSTAQLTSPSLPRQSLWDSQVFRAVPAIASLARAGSEFKISLPIAAS